MKSFQKTVLAARIYNVRCQLDVLSLCLGEERDLSGSAKDGLQTILDELAAELTEVEAYIDYNVPCDPGTNVLMYPDTHSKVVHFYRDTNCEEIHKQDESA